MTHNLHIRWNELEDPQGHAECLEDLLEDLKPDFRAVSYMSGFDSKQPERRWWQSAPAISEVGKAFESDIPTWKIGWWNDPPQPSMAIVAPNNESYESSIPLTGSMYLIFSVPSYKRYLVQNQSALAYMFGQQPREFEGVDSERVDKAAELLHEALYRIGLHPGGPWPPDDSEWKLGL